MFGPDFDIMLYVRDVGRSINFYHQALGFHFKGWWSEESQDFVNDWRQAGYPGYAEISAGPLRLSLHASDEDVPGDACIFHLRVDDVDAYHARLTAQGAEPSPPRDEPWGWRMILVDDPDGHQWGFYTDRP
jgi:uncharacterized glyoxalase superfamily protein PhnB